MPHIGDTPHGDSPEDVTPGRALSLTLDLSETVVTEPGVNVVRRGVEVGKHLAEGSFDPALSRSLKFWQSGCWTLAPLQKDLSNLHETTAGQPSILGASHFTLIQLLQMTATVAIMAERDNQAQSGLVGISYDPGAAASSDPFLVKRVPAGASTDPASVASNSLLSATPYPPSPSPSITNSNGGSHTNAPVDRVGVSNVQYPADQGFCVRWTVPGALHSAYDIVWSFGFGQYCVSFAGDGNAVLTEHCHDKDGNLRWVGRGGWRYAKASQVSNTAHSMMIWPHLGPDGSKNIVFANSELESAPPSNTSETADTKNAVIKEFVYRADPAIRGGDTDEAGAGHVTPQQYVFLDIRRDLFPMIQISLLQWHTSATLTDLAIPNSGGSAPNSNAPVLTLAKVIPSGATLTGAVKDAQTGADFVPGTDTQPYAEFSFTGDGSKTPILYGYRITQAPLTETVTPGSFAVTVNRAEVTSFAGDPSEEVGSVSSTDLTNAHPRLKARGQFSAELATTFKDPDGTTQTGKILRGYMVKPRSTRSGRPTVPNAETVLYPAANWRKYSFSLVGMFYRLAQRVSGPLPRVFAQDDSQPSGTPYKVTDALRLILEQAGFVGSQVNIPDQSVRLWPGQGGTADEETMAPGSDLSDLAVRMVRNYLGAALYYEANAGAAGEWQIIYGTQPAEDGTFTPVLRFESTPPSGKLPHVPGAYPAGTVPILSQMEYVTHPPNFNSVCVSADQPLSTSSTRVQSIATASNYASYKVPGSTVDPNPDDPDYLGYCLPLLIVDPSLAGLNSDYNATWRAVRWTARRMYDFLCHAQTIVRFQAPLTFVHDATLTAGPSNGYRLIRYQDPVSLDGDPTWLVKSVAPVITSSRMQMMEIELIQPRPGQSFYGFDGHQHWRKSTERAAQKATGSSTHSMLYGLHAVTPHAETRRLQRPLYNPSQIHLQNADGTWAGDWSAYDNATKGL